MHDVTTQEPVHAALTGGFTLIELSIVLVIIGLIVGGILVGQNLIAAAGVRATISQIEKYNTAANTFRDKYGYLPGDIPAPYATQFGLVPRGSQPGEGDGNGLIEGNSWYDSSPNNGLWECAGETSVFWVDLSSAHLIDGTFNTASETTCPGTMTLTSTPGLNNYLPQAKLGRGNYIYVWSGGWGGSTKPDGRNYFGVAAVQWIGSGGPLVAWQGMTVQEAYNIDAKIDDGMPQTGNVTPLYVDDNGGTGVQWASGNAQTDDGAHGVNNIPTTLATPGSATTCYDNSATSSGTPGVAGAVQHYSLEMNGGTNINCALSFQFQ